MLISHKQFIDKYNNKFVEVAGSPGAKNQCVDLANAYLKEVLDHPIVEWTNARDFPSKLPDFQWIENTIDALPQEGDLIIWQHNEWGHIGICLFSDQVTFTSFDQNYPTGTPAHEELHYYSRPKVAGWLRSPGRKAMTGYKGYNLDNQESMKVAVDVLVRVQNGEFIDKSEHDTTHPVRKYRTRKKHENTQDRRSAFSRDKL